MLSSNMLPCIIQEFDLPPALEPGGSLPNLNALGLQGRCLGLFVAGAPPTVSTWETARDLGPGLDANCNGPAVEGWSWGWSWRGAGAFPSHPPPTSPPSPSSATSGSPASPSPGPSEFQDTPSSKASLSPGPSEFPDTPSSKASPTIRPSEFPDTPSSKASLSPGPSEFTDTPSSKASPTTRPSEFPTSPFLGASPSPGISEFPPSPSLGNSPSLGTCPAPGPESPETPSSKASPTTGPSEFPVSPSLGTSEFLPASTSLGTSPSTGPLEFPAIPSPGLSECPASPSQGSAPSPQLLTSPSPGVTPSPEHLGSLDPPVPGSVGSTPSLPPASPSPPAHSPSPCPSPPPPPEALDSHLTPDPRLPGQGSDGPRVTTFHELALRRRRPPAPAPRSLAPGLPLTQGVSGTPPLVVTFRELRWRGRANVLGPQETGAAEGSGGSRGKADGGAKPAKEAPPLGPPHPRPQSLPLQPFLLCLPLPTPTCPPVPLLPTDPGVCQGPARVVRPSPVGAYTPPQRGSLPLPLPTSPGSGSPSCPRRWSFPTSYLPPTPAHLLPGVPTPLGHLLSLPAPTPGLPSLPEAARSDCGSDGAGEGVSVRSAGMARSLSSPGERCAEWCGMARPSSTPPPRPLSLGDRAPPLNPSHKKGLLWAVSVAVDEIAMHFSAARNVVQKTQLGDSRLTPQVGRLLLAGLCPALSAVLWDGLRPYQRDPIVGRRSSSPWSVVAASVRAGHSPRTLYRLYQQLDQVSQLNSSHKKFNAFIFALLNLKLLDFWMASLHSCTEVLRTHYTPSAFLWVTHLSCRGAFEELLLLLQPLSILAFQLDPLFEHHHPFPAEGSGPEPIPAPEGGERQLGRNGTGTEEGPGDTHPSRAAGWERGTDSRSAGAGAGYTLQETLGQVSRWAGRLVRDILEPGPRQETQENPATATDVQGKDPGWWGQLGRSCQVYLTPSRPPSGTGDVPAPDGQHNPADGARKTSEAEQLRLASLFGARVPSVSSPGGPEQHRPSRQQGRLPSDWLLVNIEHLWGTVGSSPPGPGEVKPPDQETSRAVRTVRTLCDHLTPEPGHLGFQRGDTLEVLGSVDDAWIHCRRGDASGLVPIEYTSLI